MDQHDGARARSAAFRKLGNVMQIRQTVRAGWVAVWLDQFRQDARYAWRVLLTDRGFAVTALITMALAIGANTAMFSVVNALVLRPLPYSAPEDLVMVWTGGPEQNFRGRPAYTTVEEWRRQSTTLATIAVADGGSATLTHADGAEKIDIGRVSPNLFPMLGVHPALGRVFSEQEAAEEAGVALISQRFWQARFGRSPKALGATIVIDERLLQIIGIFGRDTDVIGVANADVWVPHTATPNWSVVRTSAGAGPLTVIARLRSDASVATAQEELGAIARVLDHKSSAADQMRGIAVIPLAHHVAGSRARLVLWMLTAAVLCVLLIAVANVSSLSLARSVGRRREMALRASLGATPGRIARQLVVEAVALASVAGCLGTALAAGMVRLITAYGPTGVMRLNDVSLDLRVLAWALFLTACTGVLVALAPTSMMLGRGQLLAGQEGGGRTMSSGVATKRLQRGLVVAEFALAVTLLACAGLLVRSWFSVHRVEPGFRPERVMSLQLSATKFELPGERTVFYERVVDEVESLPQVEAAGVMGDLFVSSDSDSIVCFETEAGVGSERLRLRMDEATAGAFNTIEVPLLRGRLFSEADRADAAPVAVVNAVMARRLWRQQDPVGRRIKLGPLEGPEPWLAVVGVMGDMRRQGIEVEPVPQLFVPLAQRPSRLATLLVRTSADPLSLTSSVRAAIRRVDAGVPVYSVTRVETRLDNDLAPRRFQTGLLVGLSLVALVMAAIGIYGLLLQSVSARTKEIGIRLALGAKSSEIFRMTMGEGLQLTLAGLVLGLVGGLAAGRAAGSLLFGVAAADPLTLGAVAVVLLVAAAAACYFPARRAMKVEPIVALRHA